LKQIRRVAVSSPKFVFAEHAYLQQRVELFSSAADARVVMRVVNSDANQRCMARELARRVRAEAGNAGEPRVTMMNIEPHGHIARAFRVIVPVQYGATLVQASIDILSTRFSRGLSFVSMMSAPQAPDFDVDGQLAADAGSRLQRLLTGDN
jgi:hypothetical protein